ncbi:heme-binding-like protein At3g10130, chloroplastic isoform X5 [Nicotiana sylvestris]|uniref:heme-binding-like protein At3g10130, chloroplastic isoform X5 n=1 Tax=Nicotiana sylvestris TaxID=4096 RepID=UPI00388CC139
MLLCSPSSISAHNLSRNRTRPSPINSMAVDRSSSRVATTAPQRRNGTSALEARISLVIALASQTSSLSQKPVLTELAGETAKYVFSKRIFENRTLEEALMSVPDLETVKFNVLKRSDLYEIRQVEFAGSIPDSQKIVKVGSTDGLQNEKTMVPNEVNYELI